MADETIYNYNDKPEENEQADKEEEITEKKEVQPLDEEIDETDNLVYDENATIDSGNEAGDEECYNDYNEEEENVDKYEENVSDDGMSDELFSNVLCDLITLKSRTESRKKQSKVVPCAKKFLSLSISQRSKSMTNVVRKNLLHICDFVYKGKFPIDISIDNRRFLKHLLDKRTPKEDVEIGLTEDLRTHAIIREVIDQIENSDGYGTS
jgi:hypothetical protein